MVPTLVSRKRLLVFSEAPICLSYSGEVVVPAGNAPASSGYQPGALLLSYETMAEGVGNAPTSARADHLPLKLVAGVGVTPT